MTAPRTLAYRALRQILEAGQTSDEALPPEKLEALATRDRGFVRVLLMAVLRDYGRLKKLLTPWLKHPSKLPPEVWAVLLLGTAQLLILKTPAHAAVNESLSLAEREGLGGMKGLINAVLRRVGREGAAEWDKIPRRHNVPNWFWHSWKNYGADDGWLDILLTEPPLDITAPTDTAQWAEKLEGRVIGPQTIRRENTGDVTRLEGYAEGAWWVQDVAAAMPVQLLGDLRGLSVLDACAAPGGKTMQLLAGGARVTALDSSAQRLRRLQENLTRTKMSAEVICADVLHHTPREKFDVVLLDAPCSATGTLRRHPEMLIHKTADDVRRLAALQSQMLDRAVTWLVPNGRLLYCTCSLQPEEGEAQVTAFLSRHADFRVTAQRRILPTEFTGGNDSFFISLLRNAN